MSERVGSVVIEGVQPELDGGRYAVKRVVGDAVCVRADIYKEGHDVLVAVVRWRQASPRGQETDWREVPMRFLVNDRWEAEFTVERPGRYEFTVEGWPDLFRTWASELKRKVDVGRDVKSELLEGAALLEAHAERARAAQARDDAQRLLDAARRFKEGPSPGALQLALEQGLADTASRYPDRALARRYDRVLEVWCDREKARHSAWYEFFPRSTAGDGKRHGTFKDAEAFLPYVAQMGFDTVYLPPIHPIGRTARKGKNNTLNAQPGEPGSPWAIGAAEGGHKSVHPELGTLEDFRRFRQRAEQLGIEVALDLAYQASPDHPYLEEHPEWFLHRPDGTIKTAENPPKRYEDIVNFDWLGPARDSLWKELKSVVSFWVEQGVRTFRVDNPHTKPIPFWHWMIREIQSEHPDVLFLSEAFTRPKVMKMLAKVGFTQSYSYFTWRNQKWEIEEYARELTTPPVSEYMRANLWPNTPDILPEFLQQSGPAGFKLRVALAAVWSPLYGIYSGYELCEARPYPGKEEYWDSEKFELKAWDWDRPGNIRDYITRLNQIRRSHRALQLYDNVKVLRADNDRVVFFGRQTPDQTSTVLAAVSLDPFSPQEAVLHVPLEELGLLPDETYQAHELLRDQRALWQGPTALVQLTPEHPAAIFAIYRFRRSENAFDYYE